LLFFFKHDLIYSFLNAEFLVINKQKNSSKVIKFLDGSKIFVLNPVRFSSIISLNLVCKLCLSDVITRVYFVINKPSGSFLICFSSSLLISSKS